VLHNSKEIALRAMPTLSTCSREDGMGKPADCYIPVTKTVKQARREIIPTERAPLIRAKFTATRTGKSVFASGEPLVNFETTTRV
jgi:hypothetical protein